MTLLSFVATVAEAIVNRPITVLEAIRKFAVFFNVSG